MKKKVLIVGAGSGIGKSLLDAVTKSEEFDVYGISRRGVTYSINSEIQSGTNYRSNLVLETDINSFFDFYKYSNSTLDAIYLCQGDGLFGEISTLEKEKLEQHFQLNVFSSIFLLQKFYSLLKNSTFNPFVCFISSTAGKIGFPESVAYCASKHAVAGIAKSLREEWKKDKIRIFTIYPGAISTEIWNGREGFQKEDMILPEEFASYLKDFLYLPASINIEESYILPMKGIL